MHNAFCNYLSVNFGEEVLEKVHAVLREEFAAASQQPILSPDVDAAMLERALKAAVEFVGMSHDALQVEYGNFLVTWIQTRGFEKLVRCMSGSFFGFLRCLNNMLLHLSIDMPGFAAIECHVKEVSQASVLLHCSSDHMPCAWLKGFLRKLAEQVFNTQVRIAPVANAAGDGASQQVFTISKARTPSASCSQERIQPAAVEESPLMGLGPEKFYEMFPFHFVLDSELRVIQAGSGYRKLIPLLATPGVRVQDVLQICHPHLPWSLASLRQVQGTCTKLILSTSDGFELQGGMFQTRSIQRQEDSSLKEGDDTMLFLGSPFHCSLDELRGHKMFFSDYPSHDATADLVLMAEHNFLNCERAQQASIQTKELVEAFAAAGDHPGGGELGAGSAGNLVMKLLDQLLVGEEVMLPQILAVRRALLRASNSLWEPLQDLSLDAGNCSPEMTLAIKTMLGLSHEDGAYDQSQLRQPLHLLLPQGSACTEVLGSSYVPMSSGRGSRNSVPGSDIMSSGPALGSAQALSLGSMPRTISLGMPMSLFTDFRKKSRDKELLHKVSSGAAFSTILEARDPSVTQAQAHGAPRPGPGPGAAPSPQRPCTPDLAPGADDAARFSCGSLASSIMGRLRRVCSCSSFTRSGGKQEYLQPSGSADPTVRNGQADTASSGSPTASSRALGQVMPIPPKRTSMLKSAVSSGIGSGSADSQSALSQRSSASRFRGFEPVSGSNSLPVEPEPGGSAFAPDSSIGAQSTAPRARASWIMHRRPSLNRVEHSGGSSPRRHGNRKISETVVVSLLAPPTDQLTRALSGVDEWQFDTFQLEEASGGRPLSSLAFFLMKRMDVIKRMHINETKLARFLLRIEEGYLQDIYHCKAHAADVLRSLHVLLTRGDVLKGVLNAGKPAEQHLDHADHPAEAAAEDSGYHCKLMFCYLSAVIHDFEHRGKNNDFLIRTGDRLALLYNDCSPAENHHLAAAFLLMAEEQFAFLPNDKQMKDSMRKFVIEMVLATDMKQHFSLCGIFTSKVVTARHTAVRMSDRGSFADGPRSMPIAIPKPDANATTLPLGRMSILSRRSNMPSAAPHSFDRPQLQLNSSVRGPNNSPVSSPSLSTIRRQEPLSLTASSIQEGPGPGPGSGSGSGSGSGVSFARKSTAGAPGQRARSTLSPAVSGPSSSSLNDPPTPAPSSLQFMRQSHYARAPSSLGLQKAESGSQDLDPSSTGWVAPQWDQDTQMTVLKIALKCADLGHLSSSKDVHMHWVRRLEEEMFRQGDVERSLGQAVSPLMDRIKGGITKPGAQPGFFNVVAMPLFQSFVQVFPAAHSMLDNVKANLNLWAELEAQGKQEEEAARRQ